MPEKITLKAYCSVTKNKDGPKLKFLDKDSGLEIRFKHTQPDGPAKEQYLHQQIMRLMTDYETLATNRNCLKFTGECEFRICTDESHFEMLWNKQFRYEITLKHREAGKQNADTEAKNYRTDCRNIMLDIPDMTLTCKDSQQPVTPAECNACEKYASKYIQFPVTVAGIKTRNCEPQYAFKQGTLVTIRPANDEATYMGVYLGDLPMMLTTSLNETSHILTVSAVPNPAFWVFGLERIVFGAESWWQKVKTPDDLKAITDADIQNQFYVKLLKDMENKTDD